MEEIICAVQFCGLVTVRDFKELWPSLDVLVNSSFSIRLNLFQPYNSIFLGPLQDILYFGSRNIERGIQHKQIMCVCIRFASQSRVYHQRKQNFNTRNPSREGTTQAKRGLETKPCRPLLRVHLAISCPLAISKKFLPFSCLFPTFQPYVDRPWMSVLLSSIGTRLTPL